VSVRIEPMTVDDLAAVHRIEHASFSKPWPDEAYRSELQANRLASYLVARAGGDLIAFGGIWLMVDEAHVTRSTASGRSGSGPATTPTTGRTP